MVMARPVWSNRAAALAVATSVCVGVVASLALRPPAGGGSDRNAAGSGGTLRWRVPVAFGTNLPALGDNVLYVAERIASASGGRVVFEIYEPGELVPPFSMTEAVKDAKVPAGYTWVGYDQGRIPASVLLGSVPFGMEPWEYTAWWYQAGGRELGEQLYAPYAIRPILCGLIGPETAGWFRNEITTLDDLRGLKIRFAGIGGKVMQRLGASVTMLPGGEIFQALEKGAIDATEFSMPAIDQRLGFDRVVRNNYFPGWHQPFTAFHLVVNTTIWDDVGPADRALIETACTAGVTNNLARGEALQGAVLDGYAERGVAARSLPLPVLRQLRDVTREVLAEEASRDPAFAEILASQQAFQAQYASWKSLGFLPRDF